MADQRPEPSMEDILASIKRIIADDPAPSRPEPAAPPLQRFSSRAAGEESPPNLGRRLPPQRPDSILELTNLAPEIPAPDATKPRAPYNRAPEALPPIPPVQRAVERLREAEAEMPQSAPRPVPRDLMPRTPAPRASGGDVTLDALVREMLQPMLTEWIERNLPDIVERLVQAEIRRMTDKDG